MAAFLFYDDFGQGLSIQGRIPFSQARWRAISGRWTIDMAPEGPHLVGQQIESDRQRECALITTEKGWGAYDISVRARFLTASCRPPEGGIIIYLRYRDAMNYHAIHLCLAKQSVELWQRGRGSWQQNGSSSPFAFHLGRWYLVQIRDTSNRIVCCVDGLVVLDIIDHFPSKGRVGLGIKFCDAAFGAVAVAPLIEDRAASSVFDNTV